jgi:hypothetical protein
MLGRLQQHPCIPSMILTIYNLNLFSIAAQQLQRKNCRIRQILVYFIKEKRVSTAISQFGFNRKT